MHRSLSSNASKSGALCERGVECRNPKVENRPTPLRKAEKTICSHCEKFLSQGGRIGTSIGAPIFEEVREASRDMAAFTAGIEERAQAATLQRLGSIDASDFGIVSKPKPITDEDIDQYSLVAEDERAKRSASPKMPPGTSDGSNPKQDSSESLSKDLLTVLGARATRGLTSFIKKGRGGLAMESISSIVSGSSGAARATLFLHAARMEGEGRLSQLWTRGFPGCKGVHAEIARAAAGFCLLKPTNPRDYTLKKKIETEPHPDLKGGEDLVDEIHSSQTQAIGDEEPLMRARLESSGAMTVLASGLFASILDSDSLAAAVAHEYYHHAANHSEVMRECVEKYSNSDEEVCKRAKEYPGSEGGLSMQPRPYPRTGKYPKATVREVTNDVMDAQVNAAIGVSSLRAEIGLPGSAGYERRLLAAAAIMGKDLSIQDGCPSVEIPLVTSDTIRSRYGIDFDADGDVLETVGRILRRNYG